VTQEELLKTLSWQLGDRILESEVSDDLWVRVAPTDWRDAAQVVRDELGCHYFTFLSAIDWLVNPHLDGEKAFSPERPVEPEPQVIVSGDAVERKAGGSSRFQVFGRIYNVDEGLGITLLADLDDTLTVPSWTPVYKGADWHERETWEMFGIHFDGHPGLRNIYLPAEFEGHPLRKDFPLLARTVRPWPGLVDMEDMPQAVSDPGSDNRD
jgi:NADH-quinone oxidoreductase subunit C